MVEFSKLDKLVDQFKCPKSQICIFIVFCVGFFYKLGPVK